MKSLFETFKTHMYKRHWFDYMLSRFLFLSKLMFIAPDVYHLVLYSPKVLCM